MKDEKPTRKLATILAADCVGSVSYTHHQAHETRVDLVCRLPVEKNNEGRAVRPSKGPAPQLAWQLHRRN